MQSIFKLLTGVYGYFKHHKPYIMNHLYTWKVLGLMFLITMMSCERDALTGDALPVPESAAPTAPNKLTDLVTSSEDGMFHFADFDAFNAALDAVAPMTTKPFSEVSLRALESRLGVDDEDIAGLFCFRCCPWDCADSDETDIP